MLSYHTKTTNNGSIEFILYGVGSLNQYKNLVNWVIKTFKGEIIKKSMLPDALNLSIKFGNITLLFYWDDWEITSIIASNQEQEDLAKKIIEDAKLLKFDDNTV